MKKHLLSVLFVLACGNFLLAQEVAFEEYDLSNGLHVILHQDNGAPVVTTSVMYHVGGKDRTEGRTGFAHFFEHLLFEGSKNIPKGEWRTIVSSNSGEFNANTSQDRTYYFATYPSNRLELSLWMESERMLHPVIDQVGVDTQKEVVKEEKRLGDNRAYGQLLNSIWENLFKVHPYKDPNIGYMKDLDASTLQDVIDYNDKYYHPNNAVLVVAGDIDVPATKKMILDYFGDIPSGPEIVRDYPKEESITEEIKAVKYDPNIQIPASLVSYRTPSFTDRDFYVLDLISTYLSDGKSSKLYKKLVDTQKQALQVGAFNIGQEDYSMYIIFTIPVGETTLETLNSEIEKEVAMVRNELISESDYQKLINIAENDFINSNSSVEGIANSLARNYLLYGDTNLINKELEIYKSITREEIKEVANKYLKPNQRVIIDYLPETETTN